MAGADPTGDRDHHLAGRRDADRRGHRRGRRRDGTTRTGVAAGPRTAGAGTTRAGVAAGTWTAGTAAGRARRRWTGAAREAAGSGDRTATTDGRVAAGSGDRSATSAVPALLRVHRPARGPGGRRAGRARRRRSRHVDRTVLAGCGATGRDHPLGGDRTGRHGRFRGRGDDSRRWLGRWGGHADGSRLGHLDGRRDLGGRRLDDLGSVARRPRPPRRPRRPAVRRPRSALRRPPARLPGPRRRDLDDGDLGRRCFRLGGCRGLLGGGLLAAAAAALAGFFSAFGSSGWSSRVRPSWTARRRTMSA